MTSKIQKSIVSYTINFPIERSKPFPWPHNCIWIESRLPRLRKLNTTPERAKSRLPKQVHRPALEVDQGRQVGTHKSRGSRWHVVVPIKGKGVRERTLWVIQWRADRVSWTVPLQRKLLVDRRVWWKIEIRMSQAASTIEDRFTRK